MVVCALSVFVFESKTTESKKQKQKKTHEHLEGNMAKSSTRIESCALLVS